MLRYSQHDIMYIILQLIFLFVSHEIGPGACCWHVLFSGSGAGQQKTTRHGFYGSPILQARGLGTAKLLDADSCEDRRQEKFYTACHDFCILYSKSLNLDFKAWGLRDICHHGLFLNSWKIKTRRFKTDLTLSLILRFNLRLGATLYGVRVHRAPYKRRLSGLEHHTASMQQEVLGRSLEALDGALEVLEDDFRSTRRLQYLTTKSSRACQSQRSGTAHRSRVF